MSPALLQIISVILGIVERHAIANPGAPPLTAEQVQGMLLREVVAGEQRDLAWFLLKGLTPPD